jgi:hypothetical protein
MNSARKPFATAALTVLLMLGGTTASLASSSTVRSAPPAPSVPLPEALTCKKLIKLTQGVFDYAKEMDARGEDSKSMRETGDWLISLLDEMGCRYAIYA